MVAISSSQVALLTLCNNNPGPSISEMYEFAPIYEIQADNIRLDYMILLQEHLLKPYNGNIGEHYFPQYCIITSSGAKLLQKVAVESSEILPQRQHLTAIRRSIRMHPPEDLSIQWPSFTSMPEDEIGIMADIYYSHANSNTQANPTYSYELYYAACRGFAKLKDTRRFSRSIKGCYEVLNERKNFFEIVRFIHQARQEFPTYKEITVEIFYSLLAGPYEATTGHTITELPPGTEAEAIISTIIETARDLGLSYQFTHLRRDSLYRFCTVADDLLKEAFKHSHESIYYSVVNLFRQMIEIVNEMVKISEGAELFESREGFADKVNFARDICLILEQYAHLVSLGERYRQEACEICLEILNLTQAMAIIPVAAVCALQADTDSIAAYWIFRLLELPKKGIFEKIRQLFLRLEDFPESQGPTNRSKETHDDKNNSSIQADIETITQLIKPVLGRHQLAKGHIAEAAVREYFEQLGYSARLSSDELNHKKIDIIAQKGNEIVYAQVKNGQISRKEIEKFLESVSIFATHSAVRVQAAVAAAEFPPLVEFMRAEYESRYNLKILLLHQYQILTLVPKYKGVIG